ncbi:hypothetical protein AB1Y20_011981 [Prymnesium parvum]|uniref:SGNH hydrolase-type esterase domain-containing protein n=1 Tax=Prymnesium parvum TaxID=97485 RepID=A0AB34IQR8_PRYPA
MPEMEELRAIWPQSDLLLNQTLLERGVEHAGDDRRLACVRDALRRRRRLSLAAVGGSITAGSSYSAATGTAAFLYHRKVARALDRWFPPADGASHAHHNGGVPGTGPTYMEHCVHDHLPADVDLVLLEYAVNVDRRPEAFERLLRSLLLHPRSPALLVVNAHRWRAIRPHDGRSDKCWHRKWPVDLAKNRTQWRAQSMGREDGAHWRDSLGADEDAIAALCRRYDVPLVSMRAALVDAVRAGAISIPSFMTDCKHPSGVGHTFLAQLILQRLLRPPSPRGCEPASGAVQLPPPLYGEKGLESAASVCARGEQLRRYLAKAWPLRGFNLTDERRGPGKLGFVAHAAGDTMSFCLPWPPAASKALRPRVLWLGFLRSYEHMGRARVACFGACGCPAEVIDAHDVKDGISVTDVRRINLRPARPRLRAAAEAAEAAEEEAEAAEAADAGGAAAKECCRVRLRVLPQTTSGEHKFKVMSLLLGGADAHDLQVFSLRVAASASESSADGAAKRSGGGGGRRRVVRQHEE